MQGEAPEGTAAALVARDFKRFGLPPAIVQEFDALARPPVVIVAAGLEAETRPKEQQRTGLFIKLVRNPDQISPRHLDRARDKLAPRTTAVRSAPAAAEDPRLADVRAALAMLDEDGLQCLADQVLAAHPTPGDPHHRVLVERRGEIRTHVAWRAALENYVLTASLEQEAS